VQRIRCGLIPPLRTRSAYRNDDLLAEEPFDGYLRRALAESGSAIEHFAVSGCDARAYLVKRDVVSLLFKAKRPANDVEQDSHFSARKARQELIKNLIWDLSEIRTLKTSEREVVSLRFLMLSHGDTLALVVYTNHSLPPVSLMFLSLLIRERACARVYVNRGQRLDNFGAHAAVLLLQGNVKVD
jgi:hypothetical protein